MKTLKSIGRFVLIWIVSGFAMIGLFTVTDYLKATPVEASGGVGVVMCVKIATTGPLDAWLCEPNIGPSFLINSVGFMVLED